MAAERFSGATETGMEHDRSSGRAIAEDGRLDLPTGGPAGEIGRLAEVSGERVFIVVKDMKGVGGPETGKISGEFGGISSRLTVSEVFR